MLKRKLEIGSIWRHYKQIDPENDYKILAVTTGQGSSSYDYPLERLYDIVESENLETLYLSKFNNTELLVVHDFKNRILDCSYVIYKKKTDKIPSGRKLSKFLELNDSGNYRFTKIK